MQIQLNSQAALQHARQQAEWAGLRYSRETTTHRIVRNSHPDRNDSFLNEGAMCEVLVDGQFGYAGTSDLSDEGLRRCFDRAVATTRATARQKSFAFTEQERPPARGTYVSPRKLSLDRTSLEQVTSCLLAATEAMNVNGLIVNRAARATLIETQIDYFSSNGSETRQTFDLMDIHLGATAAQGVESQTRNWNFTAQAGGEVFDLTTFRTAGEHAAHEALELLCAPNCPSGRMDLVLMPDQMMLQIHESIGHPLELDRILGDERNYAGWSFVKKEDFGKLQFGSKLMNVTFDPTVAGEFASYAFDDNGHRATREFLIEGGILKRGLGSLESQRRSGIPGVANSRSASWNRAPIDRMANINLEPGEQPLEQLVAQVENGVWMETNRSWSIDDYRNKFQFGCERARLIKDGRLGPVVRNPNYRGTTVDFWNRLAGVGNRATSSAHGTPFCGKGEPNQAIRVGHASPACLFRAVEVFGGEK